MQYLLFINYGIVMALLNHEESPQSGLILFSRAAGPVKAPVSNKASVSNSTKCLRHYLISNWSCWIPRSEINDQMFNQALSIHFKMIDGTKAEFCVIVQSSSGH